MKMTIYVILVAMLSCIAWGRPLDTTVRQTVTCTDDSDCIDGFFVPVLTCVDGVCQSINPALDALATGPAPGPPISDANAAFATASIPLDAPADPIECASIRDCPSGEVCVGINPGGICARAEGIIGLSHFIVNLIQEDYTPPSGSEPTPNQGGPTRTSRAMAIIYLAAHDAFGLLSGAFAPKLPSASDRRSLESEGSNMSRSSSFNILSQAEFAMQAAGLTAAKLLYPDQASLINAVFRDVTAAGFPAVIRFGERIGRLWFRIRLSDGSQVKQLDEMFEIGELLRHQPDPNFPVVTGGGMQQNFGRSWGGVTPFVISDVEIDAFLGPFPDVSTTEYRDNLEEVTIKGQCNDITLPDGTLIRDIGIFWGYDSALLIGVPPRAYLQVLLAINELNELPLASQIRSLTGVSVAMADAGIAAWFWKFFYDLWRPTIGVREDPIAPEPTWNPRGIPQSNVFSDPPPPFCVGLNPNFPAYPSGHSSFGTAAFVTIAKLLSKDPKDITVTFTSDEFNGRTVEGTTGKTRRVFTQTITLEDAIQQNKDSRVFLGVHWRFDSEGGEIVGDQVAEIAATAFQF